MTEHSKAAKKSQAIMDKYGFTKEEGGEFMLAVGDQLFDHRKTKKISDMLESKGVGVKVGNRLIRLVRDFVVGYSIQEIGKEEKV